MTVPQDALVAQGTPESGWTAVLHVTVIDATGSPAQPDMTVLIGGDRIAAVGRSGDVAVPAEARVVDARGKYMIPGLWDMHVHVFDEDYLPLFLANGVTGIRHMGGAPIHHEWRRQLVAGTLLAPRMVLSSSIIDGPRPLRPYSIAVADDAAARDAVRHSKDDGADFLKVYNLLPRTAYLALADEARAHGIPFAGHVPFSVSVTEASAAGQASIEHLEGILFATSSDADAVGQELQAIDPQSMADMYGVAELTQRAAASYDHGRASEVYASFAADCTWQVPTLAVLEASAYAGSPDFPLADYLPSIPPDLRPMWELAHSRQQTPQQRAGTERLFHAQLQVVADMHRAGVELLAGTDTFVAGFSLHDELALLVRAGLAPMDSLQTATYHPARYLGVTDAFGTVAPGKLADLVLLNANPLDDIRNTRDIHAVLLAGKLLDSDVLTQVPGRRSQG